MSGTIPGLDLPTLEPSSQELRTLLRAVEGRVLDYWESLPHQPAADVAGAEEVARSLRAPMPESGRDLEELLDTLFHRAVPKSYNAAGPGYLAYIPGGGVPYAAVGRFLAAAINRYVGVWQAAPALVELEANVLRWFAAIVGLPPTAGGYLTSGGSFANFGAIVAARRRRLPPSFLDGVLYCSDQVHHSVVKAAGLAGFPPDRVRILPTDDRFRLPPATVAAAIRKDRRAGREPFLIVASAGTTNTGAIDDLPGLADLADRQGLWLHVDAAYGGFFALTSRGRERLAGLERADSVTLDPHKGLFMPYGVGCLLVRDRSTLADPEAEYAAYLPPQPPSSDEWVDLSTLSPELSRPFRGLEIWLSLSLVGADAFRRQLDEKLDLTELAATGVAALPGLRLVAPPELSLFPFGLEPAGREPEELDRLNRRLLDRVNARRRVFLTGTELGGRFTPRICILSFRTHRDRVEAALDDLATALAEG